MSLGKHLLAPATELALLLPDRPRRDSQVTEEAIARTILVEGVDPCRVTRSGPQGSSVCPLDSVLGGEWGESGTQSPSHTDSP